MPTKKDSGNRKADRMSDTSWMVHDYPEPNTRDDYDERAPTLPEDVAYFALDPENEQVF